MTLKAVKIELKRLLTEAKALARLIDEQGGKWTAKQRAKAENLAQQYEAVKALLPPAHGGKSDD